LSSSARNPGETRNIGLAAATGSWICFWDSDDYPVIDQILENVIEAEENYYQISVGNYLVGEHIKNHPVKFLDVQAARNLSDLYSNPGLWRMAFKRDVIKDVEFPNFRMGEDQIFLFKILATLPRIHFSSRITYKYMIYSDHQLTKSPEALRDVLLSFKKCIHLIEIMDDIHLREERTIKSWTNRKNALDECFQYVIFEKSSKEVFIFFIYPTKISHDR
jgi:glycosyltransferase involved in cell wall biosynthesis